MGKVQWIGYDEIIFEIQQQPMAMLVVPTEVSTENFFDSDQDACPLVVLFK